VISEFSERILEAIKGHEAAFPGTAEFGGAIEEARKIVDSLPPAFSFTFHQNPSPAAMGSDPTNLFPRLLAETEGWLGIVVHSVAFRLGHFLDDLVTGLNEARPYRAVGAARSPRRVMCVCSPSQQDIDDCCDWRLVGIAQ